MKLIMELLNFITVFTSVILILLISWYLFVTKNYWSSKGIPVVEGALPIIGNMWRLVTMRESFITTYEKFYNAHPNQSMVGFYNFQSPTLLIRDPQLIKFIMHNGHGSFSKNAFWLDSSLDPLMSKNPFFLYGSEWKSQRTTLISALSNRRLKIINQQVRIICEKFKNYLDTEIKTNGVIITEAQNFFSRFTAEVVSLCAFGIDGKSFTKESHNFHKIARKMVEPSLSQKIAEISLFYPLLRKILRYRFIPSSIDHYFRHIVRDVINSRKQTPILENDFLQHIVESENPGINGFNEDYIVGHVASFFSDGQVTTSIAIGFIIYEIAAHPDIQSKIRDEIVRVLENHDNQMTQEAIQDLKYMEQVINEAIRLYPPFGVLAKVCTEECDLVGEDGLKLRIQPGTNVIFSILGLHRDPKYWNNPLDFDPERFNLENKNNHHKFAYLPFGAGPRACLGRRIAMLQIKASLTTLIKNYSLELDSRMKIPLEINSLSSMFTTSDGDGIWIRIFSLKV